jgi:hypothetical protein
MSKQQLPRTPVSQKTPLVDLPYVCKWVIAFLSRAYKVPASLDITKAMLQSYEIGSRKMVGHHRHELAAVSRQICEYKVLVDILSKPGRRQRLYIIDLFGSKRLMPLWHVFVKPAFERVHSHIDLDDFIVFSWYRPCITDRDSVEYEEMLCKWSSAIKNMWHKDTILIMTDIYHWSPYDLLVAFKFRKAYLISQKFLSDEACGVHFDTSPFVINNFMVNQVPDLASEPYIPHDCRVTDKWFRHSGVSGLQGSLSWKQWDVVTDYNIIDITMTNGISHKSVPGFYTGEIKPTPADFYYVGEDIICHKGYNAVASNMVNRDRSSFQNTSQVNVVNMILSEPQFSVLWEYAPATLRQKILSNTVYSGSYTGIQEESKVLNNQLRKVNFSWFDPSTWSSYSLDDFKIMKKSNVANNHYYPRFNWFVLLAVILLLCYFLEFPKVRADDSVISVVSHAAEYPYCCAVLIWLVVSLIMEDPFLYNNYTKRLLSGLNKICFTAAVFFLLWELYDSHITDWWTKILYRLAYIQIVPWLMRKCRAQPDVILMSRIFSSPYRSVWEIILSLYDCFYNFKQSIVDRYMNDELSSFRGTQRVTPELLPSCTYIPGSEGYDNAGFFPLIVSNAVGVRPYGPEQFHYAYSVRNNAPVPEGNPLEFCESHCTAKAHKDCSVKNEWKALFSYMKTVVHRNKWRYSRLDYESQTTEEWVAHFNAAFKRYRAARARIQTKEGDAVLKSEAFLKVDEMLFKKILPDGRYNIKPRVIQAVDTTVCCYVQKEVNGFTDYLKDSIFNPYTNTHTIGGVQVLIAIGSGMDAQGLSDWFNHSVMWIKSMAQLYPNRDALSFIVAGDDYFGICYRSGKFFIQENDFSFYDRTEGRHALWFQRELLIMLGFNKEVAHVLYDTCFVTPVFIDRKADTKTKMPAPPQRFSGAQDTTLGNSILNICSVIYCLIQNHSPILNAQVNLGFVAKMVETETTNFVTISTFLKGWFVPSRLNDDCVWLPLPSQLVKLGVIKTDPSKIYTDESSHTAYCMAAKAMASSFKCVPDEYPLLGYLILKYKSLTDQEVSSDKTLLLNQFKSEIYNSNARHIDVEENRNMVFLRYGLSELQQLEMEKLLLETSFPSLVGHDGFLRLTEVDYGATY